MSRPTPGRIAPLAAAMVFGGLSLGLLMSCTEVQAVAAGTGRLEQVRLGFGLDAEGQVSAGCVASSFSLTDPIHLSMQVTGADAGSLLSVSVLDVVTQRIAWREDRSLPAGGSLQSFEIGRGIARGRYRVESTLGGKATNPRPFVVHDKLRSAR
jgi:hypothetical protein